MGQDLETRAVNTIRTLAIDAVQQANSGHPGAPMGLAPLAYHLYTEVMQYNPADPSWPNRDRFVLSCGHASMLAYAMLHLTGFELSMDDLKAFRQWGSKTPGHPEVHHTPGVETTTGPLGQGLANAVGMALAEARAAALTNRDGFNLVDHHTYVICSDGDLMEGVTAEACSLAGHLKLGKLIAYYDDNSITIDGATSLAFTEDVAARYLAYGWQVLEVEDINDLNALRAATRAARADDGRPSLVICKSRIGYGSPNKEGKSSSHGSPLGEDEIVLTKRRLGWPEDAHFLVPDDVAAHFGEAKARGAAAQAAWQETFDAFEDYAPEDAATFARVRRGELPAGWDTYLPTFEPGSSLATRKASQKVLGTLLERLPELIGGSADLAGSNGTKLFERGIVSSEDYTGRIICFGIREHGMASICSGMSLYGGVRPFCATFLVFTDYMRPAMRLAALMGEPVVYIMTHDSVGLGEDGPTHQPVEHLSALRTIPNMHVVRPGDANETVAAWRHAITRSSGPTVLVLTRQGLPVLEGTKGPESALRGGYILADADNPALALIATGSELHLATAAKARLDAEGIPTRVVSVPCLDWFMEQDDAYRQSVLPSSLDKRLAIEAATPMSWWRLVGDRGDVLGIETFGHSAPGPEVMERYGFSVDNVVARAKALL